MDLNLWKKRKTELHLNYDMLAKMSGVSKRTIEDIFRGFTTTPRIDTVEAIERALGLRNEKNQLLENSTSEIAEIFVRDNLDLIQEKNFNDTKLYRVMTVPQRMQDSLPTLSAFSLMRASIRRQSSDIENCDFNLYPVETFH